MARVGIFGAGWVGLVTGVCFAELGHDVVVRDVVADKVERLRRGEVPFHEERVPELLERNAERLTFTLDVDEIADCEYLFVCVDTPPTYSGDADLSRVWRVVDELPELPGRPILVMKSTVPVGTGEKIRAGLDARGLDHVGYASNPEFLAEGRAVRDFMSPDRVVIGAFAEDDGAAVARLYDGIDAPIVRTDVNSAEMIKLAANAFLMTRISFINEIANVCEATGADVVAVAEGVGLDSRLGPHFLRAGIGYGGSCLAGEETVVARLAGRTSLVALKDLYDELTGRPPLPLEVLTWHEETGSARFAPVAAVTRRESPGDLVELRTKLGRRLRCTPDHPLVTERGIVLAGQLDVGDRLPLAQGFEGLVEEPIAFDLLDGLVAAGADGAVALAAADGREPAGRGAAGRSLPGELHPDERFWRVVGLYAALGRCIDGGRSLEWSFHRTDEHDLVDEVRSFWGDFGLETEERTTAAATSVVVSSPTLVAWWLGALGVGATHDDRRVPDLIWDAPAAHKRAFLGGLWRGEGSWSVVDGGPDLVLELGPAGRGLADGTLRLLADLGVAGRLAPGGGGRTTVTWDSELELLLEEPPPSRRPGDGSVWVRVTGIRRTPHEGFVYSLEVPETGTFVTTGGLVTLNCFPKDSLALKQLASNSGYHFQLLSAVIEVNELQKRRVIGKLKRHLGSLHGKTVALLGLAFKPNTDDMREAPSIVLASRLLAEGAEVRAWDPVADGETLPGGVEIVHSVAEAVRGAHAAVIVTEWDELRGLASDETRDAMANPLIVDGRNLLDPVATRLAGFAYEGIGRASAAGDPVAAPEPTPAPD